MVCAFWEFWRWEWLSVCMCAWLWPRRIEFLGGKQGDAGAGILPQDLLGDGVKQMGFMGCLVWG